MTPEILAAVDALRAALHAEYGVDHSYVVCGQGKVLAASTRDHGVVPERDLPKIKLQIR